MSKIIKLNENPLILNEYLAYLKNVRNYSDITINTYGNDLKIFFHFLIDYNSYNITISEINLFIVLKVTTDVIYSFLVHLNYNRNDCAITRNGKLAAIKSFYKWIFSNNPNLQINNPATCIDYATESFRLPKYLTLEQAKKIIDIFSPDNSNNPLRDNLIINMFLSTGVRLSELIGININNINMQNNCIKVLGKGNKERMVYFSDSCKLLLKQYLDTRKDDHEALFLSTKKKRICKSSVERICNKAFELIGVGDKHFSPHTLRHTFATMMYENTNGDILLIKNLLGHSSIEATEIYTHVKNTAVKTAVERNPLNNYS